jgi:hypothetical protein
VRSVGRWARGAGIAIALAALLVCFFALVRPWYLSWGADAALAGRYLPGDALLWQGAPRETRAITIHAPASVVWPWVAQIGQDRGGFYSYEILENLAGSEMRNLDYLVPALQRWESGDRLWMFPPRKLGGIGQAPLAIYEPGRALVFYTRRTGTTLDDPPDGTWAFVVEPSSQTTCRLVVRARARGSLGLLGAAFNRGIFEPVHFVMERKMMAGIKARAEGRRVSRAADDAQIGLWLVTFAALVISAALALGGRRWQLRTATFLAAGLLFQLLTLVQPNLFVGIPLVITLIVAIWAPPGAQSVPRASWRRIRPTV